MRPKKPPAEKRDQRFNLRFTEAERKTIEEQAQRAGLEVTAYLRQRCLGDDGEELPPAPAHRIDPALLSALSRLGNNVNQIARAKNTDRHYSGDWQSIQAELQTLVTSLASRYVR